MTRTNVLLVAAALLFALAVYRWTTIPERMAATATGAAQNTAAEIAKLRAEVAAKANKADLAKVQVAVNAIVEYQQRVSKFVDGVDALRAHLDSLERKYREVARMYVAGVGRVGALEDNAGVDHNWRLVRISGFPTAKVNAVGEFVTCAETSVAIRVRIAEIKKVVADGWAVKEVAGFADKRPFVDKNGQPLANSDALNAMCAEIRAAAVVKELGSGKTVGHGMTAKFGSLAANRGVLVYLKRR